MESAQNDAVVYVKNLKMYFPVTRGLLRKEIAEIKAVDDVTFAIMKNETIGLVGESGCGKTTIGRCILRLYRPTSGHIFFNGLDISDLRESQMRPIRRHMGAIFQDPYGSLNPRQTAGKIAGMPLIIHQMVKNRELNDRVAELFRLVGLDPSMMDRVPHEFSGGQRQRLGIARALAARWIARRQGQEELNRFFFLGQRMARFRIPDGVPQRIEVLSAVKGAPRQDTDMGEGKLGQLLFY